MAGKFLGRACEVFDILWEQAVIDLSTAALDFSYLGIIPQMKTTMTGLFFVDEKSSNVVNSRVGQYMKHYVVGYH